MSAPGLPNLFGRATIRSGCRRTLDTMASTGTASPQVRFVYGIDGIGKTALFRAVQVEAETRFAILTIRVSAARGPLVTALADESQRRVRNTLGTVSPRLAALHDQLADDPRRRTIPVATWNAGMIQAMLREICRSVSQMKPGGVAIFIEDVQEADGASLRTLAHVLRHLRAEPRGLPVALFIGGTTVNARRVCDALGGEGMIDVHNLPLLDPASCQQFLSRPTCRGGFDWERDALEAAVRYSGGFPAALQLIGAHSWAAAAKESPPADRSIRVRHVESTLRGVFAALEPLHNAAWAHATDPQQRRLLEAMAELNRDEVSQGEIARTIGVPSRSLTPARRRLVSAEVVSMSPGGLLSFTIPGFGEYVHEQLST